MWTLQKLLSKVILQQKLQKIIKTFFHILFLLALLMLELRHFPDELKHEGL